MTPGLTCQAERYLTFLGVLGFVKVSKPKRERITLWKDGAIVECQGLVPMWYEILIYSFGVACALQT